MKRKAEDDSTDAPASIGDKKHKKHKKEKREKKQAVALEEPRLTTLVADVVAAAAHPETDNDSVIVYPYEVDDADHCESPVEAYKHISFFLGQIATILGKSNKDLRIYDPYFCEGSMVKRLGELGFQNVYNSCPNTADSSTRVTFLILRRKEDFYAVTEAEANPEFDVLVTNPPYSGDNVDKLMKFSLSRGKPFFLLMPNYVYEKDYYSALRAQFPSSFPSSMFYVSPKSRYLYTTPKGRRQGKSAKYTSPFPSFWYCSLGVALSAHRDRLLGAGLRHSATQEYSVAPSSSCLPLDVLADTDPRKKKYKNSLKRKKHKARKKQ